MFVFAECLSPFAIFCPSHMIISCTTNFKSVLKLLPPHHIRGLQTCEDHGSEFKELETSLGILQKVNDQKEERSVD